MTKPEIAAVKIRQFLSRLVPGDGKRLFSSAIITAAGSGTRMGGAVKALVPLAGKPCLWYSLDAMERCERIDEVILTIRREDRPLFESFLKDFPFRKVKALAEGGATRQESVKNGFQAVSAKSDLVWIHDGARPVLTGADLEKLFQAVTRYGAATAANSMVDTVKRVGKNGRITETVPRDDLFTVQTPQVFRTDLYRVSLALAEKDGFTGTDDCSLAEHAGFSVYPCETNRGNLKLTTQDQVLLLEGILKEMDR